MAEDRIGELRIRIRTDTVGDEDALRREAERFARSVLDRALQLLEERAPGRLVFLRELPLQWRLAEDALGDAPRIEVLASELVDALENALPPPTDAPSPSADAVVFRDEAHHLASYLVARARGERAWFHRSLDQGLGFEAVAASRSGAVSQTLVLLASRGELAEALSALAAREIHALTAAFERGASSLSFPEGERGFSMPGPAPSLLRHIADTYRTLPPPARALALHVEARRIAGPNASSAEIARRIDEAWGGSEGAAHMEGVTPSSALDEEALARGSQAVRSGEAPGAAKDSARAPRPAEAPAPSSTVAPRPGPQSAPPDEPEESSPLTVATRFGGLFYLLNPLMELEIPEALWKACLPEGEVLAYLAHELLGLEGEQAATLVGGAPPPAQPPEVSAEQQAEFSLAVAAQLVAAFPRRGLSSIPRVVVGLHEHPSGRLLCATAVGSPFALFAWPASSREELTTGLRQLAAAWPATALLHAPPALAAAAPGGRLQPLPRELPLVPLHLPGAPSPAAAALLSQAIGAPCQLLLARSGEQVDSVSAFTKRFLARNARVSLPAGQMTVTFSGGDVDLALRKSGLDRDPGWLTWLERTARFEFETAEL